MAENVALTKNKQKSFSKTVQNYKSLLKKGEIKISEKVTKKVYKYRRGIVYLGNIPHGFYESELKEYFSQFGVVTRLRLARSQKTGNSRGFAFIEFKVPEVAQIVAETMDRYLMGKRLLKAQYIPPEKQHKKHFIGKAYTTTSYPKKTNRNKQINNVNANVDAAKNTAIIHRILSHVNKIQKRLANHGIHYNITCVDIPDHLKSESSIPDSDAQTEVTSEESDDDIVFQPPQPRIVKTKPSVLNKKNHSGKVEKVNKIIVKTKPSGLNKKKHSGKVEKVNKRIVKNPINKTTKKLSMLKNAALNSSQVELKVLRKK